MDEAGSLAGGHAPTRAHLRIDAMPANGGVALLVGLDAIVVREAQQGLVRHAEQLRVGGRLVAETDPGRDHEGVAALPGQARAAGLGLAASFGDDEYLVGGRAMPARALACRQ